MSRKLSQLPTASQVNAFDEVIIRQVGSAKRIRVDALTSSFGQIGSAFHWQDEVTGKIYRLTMKNGNPTWEEVTDGSTTLNGTLLRWQDEVTGIVYKLTMKNGNPTWVELGS